MNATETVKRFFEAYRQHDVEEMAELCDDNASFRYMPVESWGRQRVVRGEGKVRGIGKAFWTTLIDSFPDLTNEVTWASGDDSGNVACEVVIGGNQEKDFGTIASQQKSYSLPHLFFFHVNRDGLIDDIAGYWDGADWYRQLGRLEVD